MSMSILSVERYIGICHPFLASKYHHSSKPRALKAIFLTWLLGFLFTLPTSLQTGVIHHIDDPILTKCTYVHEIGRELAVLDSIFFLVIPIILISTMYVLTGLRLKKSAQEIRSNNELTNRSKQRAPKMLSKNTDENLKFFKVSIKNRMLIFKNSIYFSGYNWSFFSVLDAWLAALRVDVVRKIQVTRWNKQ